ncbi:nucleoside triphosphate pyrophosphohydrolase [Streptomyces sp. NPDC093249]|uniref:nucleoside triphosphate pyrophosphohydrolase n=1 Tax=unclassified Streptomyces TaxID=2593676 RepID=UPI0037F79D8D
MRTAPCLSPPLSRNREIAHDRRHEHRLRQPRHPCDAEYPGLLLAKLYEELGELAHADISAKPEELADLTEALDAYAWELGIAKGDLEALRADKRRKRGGFSDGVVWLGNR